jgi:DegV family protein with EDD domain
MYKGRQIMIVKIIPDSSANMRTDENRNLISVPLKITTDEKEYIDNNELDVRAMADDLMAYKGKSGSACPGTGDWMAAFEGADWIFAVTITSNLSGAYNAAVQAKNLYEEEHPGAKVYVKDSLSTGPEMQLLVEKMKEDVLAEMSFEDICADIEEYSKKTHLAFSLESLENLAKNGRVNPLVAKAAGVLGVRVVGKASDEGTLQQLHKCRGEKKAVATMYNVMKEHGFAGGKVRMAHIYNEGIADALEKLIRADYPDADVQRLQCGGLCTFYAEVGGMLVGYEG